MLIFPFIEDGFVFFTWRRGISLITREKKGIYGYCSCLPVKGTFYLSWEVRLYRTILHFLNVHDSCTVSVCNEKLRDDLIKGTYYTPDYLGSIKNDGFQAKTESQIWRRYMNLTLHLLSLSPHYHYDYV